MCLRTSGGQHAWARGVASGGPLWLRFRLIYGCVGCGVNHHLSFLLAQDSCYCFRISDIELRSSVGQAFNSPRRARSELSSQLSAGPQDDDFV